MVLMRVAAFLLAWGASASVCGAGERYLNQKEALAVAFPDGPKVVRHVVELDPAVRKAVEERYGTSVASQQEVFVGIRDGSVSGYAMILTEVTKTLPATFIVAISPRGEITRVAVMSHEDHIGIECRRERFVEQFRGKTARSRLSVPNGGILHVSGATLSCQAVARGTRKALAIVQYHLLDHPERIPALIEDEPVRQKRFLMGSFCVITAYGDAAAVEQAFDEILRLEKVLSNYDEKSELSKFVREREGRVGPDLLSFLKESQRYAELTEGAFDITVAPLVRLWGFKDGAHRVPSAEEIQAEIRKVGSKRIEIDGDRVRLPEGMELDPGAIGKGIAVDRAAEVLRRAGVRRALVDFGSSAFALGCWDVAIRDPFQEDGVLGQVALEDEALSTSGSYENFFKVEETTYSHILDPRTGRPVQGVAGVSVVAPTGAESDAFSTALFVRREITEEPAALIALDGGEIRMNGAFERKFRKGTK